MSATCTSLSVLLVQYFSCVSVPSALFVVSVSISAFGHFIIFFYDELDHLWSSGDEGFSVLALHTMKRRKKKSNVFFPLTLRWLTTVVVRRKDMVPPRHSLGSTESSEPPTWSGRMDHLISLIRWNTEIRHPRSHIHLRQFSLCPFTWVVNVP
jgi:hypothetical protein